MGGKASLEKRAGCFGLGWVGGGKGSDEHNTNKEGYVVGGLTSLGLKMASSSCLEGRGVVCEACMTRRRERQEGGRQEARDGVGQRWKEWRGHSNHKSAGVK